MWGGSSNPMSGSRLWGHPSGHTDRIPCPPMAASLAGSRGPELVGEWRLEEFVASLTGSSANTIAAYTSDLRLLVEWVERSGVVSPAGVDRLLLRRYVASLSTRQFAKRSIAR